MEAVETEREGPLTLKLYYDEEPSDPREDREDLGTMVCWHRRANLGDKTVNTEGYESLDELVEELAGPDGIVLPLFLYEHSGMTMSTSNRGYPFNDRWDAGQVGFIFATQEDIARFFMGTTRTDCSTEGCNFYTWTSDRDAQAKQDAHAREQGHLMFTELTLKEMAREVLVAEVEEYDQWLRGDVYGYVIEDEHGERIDSCWGFYGYEYALKEARSSLTACAERVLKDRAEAEKHAVLVDAGDLS